MTMGAKNISISDEAYARLAAMKRPNESFTDVVNRLTGKRSLLELAGLLSEEEAKDLRARVNGIRSASDDRVKAHARRVKGSC
jgi:predicted CopG family antitoxin